MAKNQIISQKATFAIAMAFILLLSACTRYSTTPQTSTKVAPLESAGKEEEITKTKIIFYKEGMRRIILGGESSFTPLKSTLEDMFLNSNDALYTIVDEESINVIRTHEMAVEIVYEKPIELTTSNPTVRDTTIKIDRIMVPLRGQSPRTIFYGLKKYSSGPFLYLAGTNRVVEILKTYQILE